MDPSGQILRDRHGRFLVGGAKPPGSGRTRLPERAYIRIFREELTEEKWREIVQLAIADATDTGEKGAVRRNMGRTWLARYALAEARAQDTEAGHSLLEHLLSLPEEERAKLAAG